ncbi:hypothetical protein Clacol_010281 [Clathrus columnatus]|uniref:UDP-galactose transporter n=1 Tax=Clathrus columnatus TaxID=1419009 RepID=A0AAV5AQG1_9AGAM|nr:hypothetical protein Clacol_010281 [Clathrus columnatus]
MHISRTTTPPSEQYSAASAVLLNELFKGSISLAIAMYRIQISSRTNTTQIHLHSLVPWNWPWRRTMSDIFSSDCWKLSIPAILYVFQNNLQYVAASNLDAATFQVTYQMKILTTAGFSVILLRKQLSKLKWGALFLLALGVGIVQIQSGDSHAKHTEGMTHMNPITGFLAVCAACFTSGLAGVYFEMVLKNSTTDLWIRNVQLSLFSLIPALLPAIWENNTDVGSSSFFSALITLPARLLHNFTFWAWATVLTQVLGGLITALVIKHADNILKGFATSLSIVLSFIASVILFQFPITGTFLLGAIVVLVATWLYNRRDGSPTVITPSVGTSPLSIGDSRGRTRNRMEREHENIKLYAIKSNSSHDNMINVIYPSSSQRATTSSSPLPHRRFQTDIEVSSSNSNLVSPIDTGFDLDITTQNTTIEKAKTLLSKLGISPSPSPAPSRPHSPLPLIRSSSSENLSPPPFHATPNHMGSPSHPIYTPPPSRPSSPTKIMLQVTQMVHLGVSSVKVGSTSSRAGSRKGSGDSVRSSWEERRGSNGNVNGVRTSSESEGKD